MNIYLFTVESPLFMEEQCKLNLWVTLTQDFTSLFNKTNMVIVLHCYAKNQLPTQNLNNPGTLAPKNKNDSTVLGYYWCYFDCNNLLFYDLIDMD